MSAGPADEELLGRHLDGDADAFTELVTRHERRVYGICLRVLGNPEDAADATQEAFLAVLRRAGSFQGGAAFSTWLYRVAVNAALDLARRRSRLRTVALEPEGAPPAAAVDDPGEAVATALTVQAALVRVPEEFRVAIVLCDLCRLPYAEAAAIIEVAVGTVKSRVFRGRAALARELHGLDPRARQGNPGPATGAGGRLGAVPGTAAGTVPGTAAALAASEEQTAIQQAEE
jgi:RNA polymerase sigma-70 factor, ECF subfamily